MTSIIIKKDAHIVSIGINRPEKRNSLSLDMFAQISEAVEQADADPDCRCVVIHGLGGHFCSGIDLSAFPKGPSTEAASPVMRLVEAIVGASVPIVAAVEGVAAGLGATMLLHMDSVVAADNARIVYSFINLALPPEAGSSLLLPQLMGYARAAELVLLGGTVDADQALRVGLVTRTAPAGTALEEAMQVAARIATKPPQAARRAKKLLKGDTQSLMQRIVEEEAVLFEAARSAEAAEAMQAFIEKRPAQY